MSQLAGLTQEQVRVLEDLERSVPDAHSARDVSRRLGMDVPAALAAPQALLSRGDARLGPGAPNGTPEAEVYEATTRRRLRGG